MIRPEEPGKNWTGNDRYMGYCVDLAKRIAEMVNFTYELRLVRDGNFGTRGLIQIQFNFISHSKLFIRAGFRVSRICFEIFFPYNHFEIIKLVLKIKINIILR